MGIQEKGTQIFLGNYKSLDKKGNVKDEFWIIQRSFTDEMEKIASVLKFIYSLMVKTILTNIRL